MKSIYLLIFVILLYNSLYAKTITFEWDAHNQASLITGFKLYKRSAKSVYNFSSPATYIFPSGSSTTITLNVSDPYFFVLRAYAEGSKCNNFSECTECPCYSDPSDEVSNTVRNSVRIHFMRH